MIAKVLPLDVLDCIKRHGPITVGAMAKQLNVSGDTVRKKLKVLRTDGEPLYSNGLGYHYSEKIDTDEEAQVLREFQSYILGMSQCMALNARNTKKLMIQAARLLKVSMTPKERRLVKNGLTQIVRLIDTVNVDMQVGE